MSPHRIRQTTSSRKNSWVAFALILLIASAPLWSTPMSRSVQFLAASYSAPAKIAIVIAALLVAIVLGRNYVRELRRDQGGLFPFSLAVAAALSLTIGVGLLFTVLPLR